MPKPKPATPSPSGPGTILASFPRGRLGRVLVTLGAHRGAPQVHLRTWWQDATGTLRPTRKGVALGAAELLELRGAIDQAILATAAIVTPEAGDGGTS